MTFTKALVAGAILTFSVTSPAQARRRPIVLPAPPSLFVPAVEPTTLTLTNYSSTPAHIRACLDTCVSDTLAPNASGNYAVNAGMISVFSDTPSLEARTRELDGIARPDFLNDKSALPVYDTKSYTQIVRIFSPSFSSMDLALLGSNGVQENVTILPLVQDYNDFDVTTFDNAKDGMQLELRPNTPISAFLIRSNNDGSIYLPAQQLSRAAGAWYVLGANNATSLTEKNPDPTRVLNTVNAFYSANTEIRAPPPFSIMNMINYGIKTMSGVTLDTAKGAMIIEGPAQSDFTYSPLLPWAIGGNSIIPVPREQAALGFSGVDTNKSPAYNSEISGVADSDTIGLMQANDTFDTVSGTINGYKNGVKSSSWPFTLRGRENVYHPVSEIAPGADRIELEMDKPTVHADFQPAAIMTTSTPAGYTHNGYRLARAATKVTGEQYVTKWLDPLLSTNYFYINKAELTDLLTSTYGDTLLTNMYNSSIFTGTLDQYRTQYKALVDGDFSNFEVCQTEDPGYVQMVIDRGIMGIEIAPSCNPSKNPINNADLPSSRTAVRDFFIWRTETKPQEYGGSSSAGPSLGYDPTFTVQNHY
jgi:hypothetical protein